ncbi:MAG: hypothetical protein IT426_21480 [Pirellulales bacterium]|nr:hypothetical protein [Pirellulales bacterium]
MKHTKLVREGSLIAEVEVELIESDQSWAPYLTVEEAKKLDEVRLALQNNDIAAATKFARVFRLTPVSSV